MNDLGPTLECVRFGCFEVDLRNSALRKQGFKIKLQEKPFQVLAVLLEHAGEVVTREELRQRLWPADTFVDFDANLNTALNKLRQALGDSAENPRFVQTIPRRGYCFISPLAPAEVHAASERPAETSPQPRVEEPRPRLHSAVGQFLRTRPMVAALALLAVVLAVAILHFLGPGSRSAMKSYPGHMMLVVLPFENMSGDPEQEYFSEGVTEEMITQAGRLSPRRLGVLARASVMQYKGTHKPLGQIAHELGADYVLEGSVRRVGDRVRITAQLVQARDQTQLWAESYERNVSDALTIQREVAGRIAQSLALELLGKHGQTPDKALAVNVEAYEEYLKGRYFWNRRTNEGLRKGLEHFQQAILKDPRYAPAYVGVADSYMVLANWMMMPSSEAYPRSQQAALKALTLDDQLAEAHVSLAGAVWEYDHDAPRAEKEFLRALELNPGYATAHQWYAEFLSEMGRHEEAITEIRKAREADPRSLIINAVMGLILYNARRYDEAIKACRNTLEMDPDFMPAHTYLWWIYMQKGMYDEAVAALQELQRIGGVSPAKRARLRRAYVREGMKGVRRWLLSQSFHSQPHYVSSYNFGVLFAELGERDTAFEWLQKAYDQHDVQIVRLKVDPRLDSLHSDARFRDLVRRVGLPP